MSSGPLGPFAVPSSRMPFCKASLALDNSRSEAAGHTHRPGLTHSCARCSWGLWTGWVALWATCSL